MKEWISLVEHFILSRYKKTNTELSKNGKPLEGRLNDLNRKLKLNMRPFIKMSCFTVT